MARALINLLAEHRFAEIKISSHAWVLAALAREHKHYATISPIGYGGLLGGTKTGHGIGNRGTSDGPSIGKRAASPVQSIANIAEVDVWLPLKKRG